MDLLTRMKHVDSYSGSFQPGRELLGMQNVGQLGLRVRGERVVALLPVQVVPVHTAVDVSHARHNHDPEIFWSNHCIFKESETCHFGPCFNSSKTTK